MANISQKKKTTQPRVEAKAKKAFLSPLQLDVILIAAIAVMLLVILKPLVIDGLSPQGVDVIGNLGKSHNTTEYFHKTGQRALWNPNVFCGMPVYYSLSPNVFSIDVLLEKLGWIINLTFLYHLLAAGGMYFLLRYLKMSAWVSLFGAIAFILMPHYKSLWLEGHFAKFKALMFLPWIVFSFKYFLDKRNLAGAAFFALMFGNQIRTQHYQIVFYTGLLIFAIGLYPFIKDLLDKQYKRFTLSAVMLFAAIALGILMAAQPLFLAKEYLPYSKRGKTTINVDQNSLQTSSKTDGVSLDYATQWSTHPSELLTWFVPHFLGGMSAEKYQGSKVPQARGQMIPGYWGYMPFTQSYEYMGALTLLLAAIGLWYNRRNKEIISLAIFALFLVLLSFGQFFKSFYGLFYDYVPFFNKFRAPMMSVTVTFFIVTMFAVHGLNYLSSLFPDKREMKSQKGVLYIIAGFIALGVILWLAGQSISFVKAAGERYQGDTLQLIRTIRKELFTQDVIRYIILTLLGGGAIIAFLKSKINASALAVIFVAIALFDLISMHNKVSKDYTDIKRLEASYFRETGTDRFLKSDPGMFRIFPAGDFFTDNRWAYNHQTIGGYSPIKMYVIEELVENNIYKGWDAALPFNWNVLKILNVRYVVLPAKTEHSLLTPVYSDEALHHNVYRFNGELPRAFFVGQTEVIRDEFARIKRINSREFDPAETAILEEEPGADLSTPDSSFAKVIDFSPNKISIEAFTNKQALLVISEVDYPPGWKISIDGKPAGKIYKTDHAVQSIVVPEGRHTITMDFAPHSYSHNVTIAGIAAGILYLTLLGGFGLPLLRQFRKN